MASITSIMHQTGMHKQIIYDNLERLIKKG